MHFSGKGRHSLHINVMRISKMLISFVRLDHMLYSINYSTYLNEKINTDIILLLYALNFAYTL